VSDNTTDPTSVQAMPKRDYEIGYGRPPVATRFRLGGVGNPKGRPKRAKTVGRIIQDAMMTPVRIEVNGKPKTMTAQEVIIRNLVRSAARGDTKAIQALFGLKARYQDSAETTLMPSDLEANDRKIIEDYLAKVSAIGTGETPQPRLVEAGEGTDQNKAKPPNGGPDDEVAG
jgi:Family of unknown function (DUF5681)